MADKIVRVEKDNNLYWGVLEDDTVTVIDGDLYTGYNKTEIEFALSDVTLKAPVQPSKIICVGLNYAKHVTHSQSATEAPKQPLLFMKPPSSIIGPEENIIYPDFVDRVDYEAEMGIVIKKKLHKASPEEVSQAIFA